MVSILNSIFSNRNTYSSHNRILEWTVTRKELNLIENRSSPKEVVFKFANISSNISPRKALIGLFLTATRTDWILASQWRKCAWKEAPELQILNGLPITPAGTWSMALTKFLIFLPGSFYCSLFCRVISTNITVQSTETLKTFVNRSTRSCSFSTPNPPPPPIRFYPFAFDF